MAWLYVQSTGQLFFPDGRLRAIGYAGTGKGRNNPLLQCVKKTGPLCVGLYDMVRKYDSQKTGPYTIELVPRPENRMCGRGDFRVHGDNAAHDASEGCIIQIHSVREEMWENMDHVIEVVAYPR